jgi:iron complex transport system substrate-binding protein
MGKWLWLFLVTLCWIGSGLVISGLPQGQDSFDTAPPTRVNRIVSMAPNLTEVLFKLGLGDEIVGVTLDSDYPPAAEAKPKVGTFWQPNIEAVIAARPDLVITLGFNRQRSLAERLKRVGYDCLLLDIDKVDGFFEAVRKIGSATGSQEEANELEDDIRKRLDNLAAFVGKDTAVRVLWVVQRQPLRVAGQDTFVNEMVELAGGENAIGPTLHKYPPIGAEQVIACRPDVIIEPAMGEKDLSGQIKEALEYWNKFRNLPAVREGRIYVIDGDTVSRLGPRLYEGVEAIAKCLRPHLFENLSNE